MNTKEILILKKNLLKGLSENVFKEFTKEEDNYLHSKHGKLIIDSKNSGIVGAFKAGITIVLDTGFTITCTKIDWQNNRFLDIYDTWHKFEFVPIRLNELI